MDLIDRDKLIKDLNEVAMQHHESHIPMTEHDFRQLIHDQVSVNPDQYRSDHPKGVTI